MPVTKLDYEQVIQQSFDEGAQAIRVTGGTSGGVQAISGEVSIVGQPLEVELVNQPIGVSGEVLVTSLDLIGTFEIDSGDIQASVGDYFTISAGLSDPVKKLTVYDTTGFTMHVGTGASGAETLRLIMGPGCDQTFDIEIPASTRIAIRAASAAPSGGSVIFNFQG